MSSPDQQPPTRASRQVHAAGAVAKRGGGSRRQAAEEDQHPGGHGAQKPTCPKWLFFCWGEWRAKVALRIEAEQGSTRTRTNQRRKKKQGKRICCDFCLRSEPTGILMNMQYVQRSPFKAETMVRWKFGPFDRSEISRKVNMPKTKLLLPYNGQS